MKTFVASVEERYIWECPCCNEMCDSETEDPESEEFVVCDYCGEEIKCEYTQR